MKISSRIVFWAFLLLLSSFGQPAHKTILFFGDSLTAAYGLDPELGFPNLIQKRLEAKHGSYTVISSGLSGETSAGGLARINWVLKSPVDIFVLELGANDGLRGLPLSATKANLQGIINKVKLKYPKVKIVIAGMMVPPNMGPDYSNQFREMYPELAKKNQATLIPFLLEGVAGIPNLNLPDGIHPNAEGQKIVAENVWKVIGPLL